MGQPLAVLVARFLLEIEVLPNEEQEVPEVSSEGVGCHFTGMVELDAGLYGKRDLDMDEEFSDESRFNSGPGLHHRNWTSFEHVFRSVIPFLHGT